MKVFIAGQFVILPEFAGWRPLDPEEKMASGDELVRVDGAPGSNHNPDNHVNTINNNSIRYLMGESWKHNTSSVSKGFYPYRLVGAGGYKLPLNKFHSEPVPLP